MFGCCCAPTDSTGEVVVVDSVQSLSTSRPLVGIPLDDFEAPSILEDIPPPVLRHLGGIPAQQPEPGDFIEFEAVLDKTGGQKLGLDISAYDGKTLLVGKVKPGPVEKWNWQNAGRSDQRIARGDRIVAVNGVRDDSDGLLNAARADVLCVTVRRLIEFVVAIECNGYDSLGLDFADSAGQGVVVSHVDGGVAEETNELNPADLEVRPGDLVLQFNGRGATTADVMRVGALARTTARAPGILLFRLRRPEL